MSWPGRLGRTSLLTIAGLTLATSAVAAAAPSPQGAVTQLRAAQGSLRAGRTAAAEVQLDSAAAAIPAAGAIATELRSGEVAPASHQLAQLLNMVGGQPLSPGTVRHAVNGVYRSSELAGLGRSSSGGNSLVSELASFLGHLAKSIFHAVAKAIWITLALVVLAAGAAACLILLRRSSGPLAPPRAEAGAVGAVPARIRPERLFARAEQLRSEGRFGESVRVSFQALLLSASDRRVLDVDPSWTNSELLRAAARVGELEPALRPLVARFNHVVYGGEDPGPEGCRRFTVECQAAVAGLAP